MTTLNEIFSEENMLEYARVCIEIARDLPEEKHSPHAAFDTILIPSRGAVPFFLGTVHAMKAFADSGFDEHDKFYRGLGVQSALEPLLPPASNVATKVEGKQTRVLLIPFTADLNMEKYDPTQNSDEYISRTRRYWTKVVAAFFEERAHRSKDPYFRAFTDVILRDIELRDRVAEEYEAFPKIDRLSMLDTVISGRAAKEILGGFDALASEREKLRLCPFAFLVVDENGAKLNSQNRAYLKTKEALAMARTYETPRIVSEDKGASFLGVAALTYPSVMQASKRLRDKGRGTFIGAGSWRLCTEIGEDAQNSYFEDFDRFMTLVYSAIDARFVADYTGKGQKEMEKFGHERSKFVDYVTASRIYGNGVQENPEILGLNPNYEISQYFETNSRVGHIAFTPDATNDLLRKLCAVFPDGCIEKEQFTGAGNSYGRK